MTTVGSLCSGYGGLDLGLQLALGVPLRHAWHVEYDKHPSSILAARFPGVPNLHDLTTLDWAALEPVDWLTAGFPCQPFSHAGKRAGERDERHLWPYIQQGIATLRPANVLLENVRGLLSSGGTFDEPNDRCLCGWPLRRGGVRRGGTDSRGLDDQLPDRDDREGEDAADTDAVGVRRNAADAQGSHGRMGRGLGLEPVRSGSSGLPDGGVALLDDQEAGGGTGAQAGAGAPDLGALFAREFPEAMDAGGQFDLLLPAREDQGAEPAWAGQDTTAFDDEDTDCPACGRPVAGAAVGSVQRSGFGTVLSDLARLGYDARWGVVRASDAGAPHGRARIFIVAADTSWVGHEGRPGDQLRAVAADEGQLGRQAWGSVRSGDAVDGGRPTADASGRPLAGTSAAGVGLRVVAERGAGAAADTEGDAWRSGLVGLPALGSEGDSEPSWSDPAWGAYAPAIARWERVTGRTSPRPTEPGRTGERLSPRFVEWMMGLPDGWVTQVPGLPRNAQLKALGNGVVPQQAALALRMLQVLAVAA